MAKFHKCDVYRHDVYVTSLSGESVTVEGVPMIRLSHGTIVKAEGYHSRLSDAKREAADLIDEYRGDLAAKAAALRAEADGLDTKEGLV